LGGIRERVNHPEPIRLRLDQVTRYYLIRHLLRKLPFFGDLSYDFQRINHFYLARLQKRIQHGTCQPETFAYRLSYPARKLIGGEMNMCVPETFPLAHN